MNIFRYLLIIFKDMNTYIIHSSLKYIKRSYEVITKLANWIHEELVLAQYSDCKLLLSLDYKDFEIIKYLIKYIKDPSNFDNYIIEYCPWRFINFETRKELKKIEELEILKLMIQNGANIHINDDYLLMSSCYCGNYLFVKFLIDFGVDITIRDNQALINSIKSGNLELVKLLIKNGADPRARINNPLRVSMDVGNNEITKYLTELLYKKLKYQ
jgi:ankyrin repeat protein